MSINNFHNQKDKLIFRSEKFFPWYEVISTFILVLIPIIYIVGAIIFNSRLTLNNICVLLLAFFIYLFLFIYIFFLFDQNDIEIYENNIKIFPSSKIKYFSPFKEPIIINNNNIKEIRNHHLSMHILFTNELDIYNSSKKYLGTSFSMSPSGKHNRERINEIFIRKFGEKFKNPDLTIK